MSLLPKKVNFSRRQIDWYKLYRKLYFITVLSGFTVSDSSKPRLTHFYEVILKFQTPQYNRIGYVENIVSDILADRFEEDDDEDENWPPNQLTQHKRKKSVLPKFDHLETY